MLKATRMYNKQNFETAAAVYFKVDADLRAFSFKLPLIPRKTADGF